MTRRWPIVVLAAGLAWSALASPAGLAGQQPDRPPPTPPTGAPGAPAGAAPDTVPADTARELTPRERAMLRLRAMPERVVEAEAAEGAEEGAEEVAEEGAELEFPPPTVDGVAVRGPRPDRDAPVREDSVRRLLRELPGYTMTEYRGDGAVFEGAGSRLNLTGKSRVSRDGHAMDADSVLTYSGERGIVCGYGNPVLTGDQDPLHSDRVCYDLHRDVGMATHARTTFNQGGATWYVGGDRNRVFLASRAETNALYGERAQFTSCELEAPHYTFQAQSLKMLENDVMVARNVTLRFADVPVFWLPWMVQSMKPDRQSGLLMPQFGVNDIVRNSSGYNRSISNLGFFWAINDYLSSQASFEWFSNNYTAVQGNFAYRWQRQFLSGHLTARQYWHQSEFGPGRRDMTINTANNWQPDERTRINVTGDYATSTSLVRDYSFDPNELNQRITANAGVNRSFDWGNMSLSARRQQTIHDDRLDWTLPSFNMSLRPITLVTVGEAGQGLTWSGGGSASRQLTDVNEMLPGARNRDRERVSANANHTLSFGRFSVGQNVSFEDESLAFKPALEEPADTALPARSAQTMNWGTNARYMVTLRPGTTLTPNISISGRQIRNDTTGGIYVAEPNRIRTGASLGSTIYGFWPGFGQFDRIRHKISPTLSWSYSPLPQVTELQESIFPRLTLREQNQISLSFNQTFEARVAADEEPRPADGRRAQPGQGDPAAAGAEAAEAAEGAEVMEGAEAEAPPATEPGEPRRLPRSRVVNLLAINTSPALLYDFVGARDEGRGFLTDRLTNSIRSDLVPGLQLSMQHELFDYGDAPEPGALRPREFDPFLTSLSTSFSIDQDFWLFRTLGLSGGAARLGEGEDPQEPEDEPGDGMRDMQTRMGSTIPRGGRSPGASMAPGGWRASLSYNMVRRRPDPQILDQQAQQTVRGDLSFQPTENWSVNWSTGYSFTDGQFSDHYLTLSRDLHRWQANFHFIRAQNGNFSMRFSVHLRDNPDLKVDYDQHTTGVDRRRQEAF